MGSLGDPLAPTNSPRGEFVSLRRVADRSADNYLYPA